MRILIVDDHGLVRAGLRALLKAEPGMEVVGEAADGYEALNMTAALHPDVVLADISMPGPNGIEVARELKASQPDVRVLITTMHEDLGLLHEALQAGAAGYLVKRAAETDLIRAVQTVARGETYIHDHMRSLASPAVSGPALQAGQPTPALTSTETDVLRLLAMGRLNQQVATDLDLTLESVEALRADVMRKLGVRSRVGLVEYARRLGII